jgi:hypothetical protein
VNTASRDQDTLTDAEADHPEDSGRRSDDRRRRLQLVLAALWLLDAMLQGQSFMFSPGFARMIAVAARGSPSLVVGPGDWAARLIGQHPVATNSAFVAVQLLLAIGIAWRPTVKFALALSVPWSMAIWWLGEGLGGVLAPGANPVTGAPGAVILYALLAIVLWPADRTRGHDRTHAAAFPPVDAVGVPTALAAWLALWCGMAWLTAASVSQPSRALPDAISALAAGQPRWLAATDDTVAGLISGHQIAVAVTLAILLVIIAVGPFLPASGARTALALAIVVALVTWVVGQNFGGILTGTGTDPGTGPLLVLLAAAYWPTSPGVVPAQAGGPDLRPTRPGWAAPWLSGRSGRTA